MQGLFPRKNPIMAQCRWGLLLLVFRCVCGFAESYIELPKLADRVTDLTGTLTPAQVSALEQKLAAFEAKKGAQIAVLIVGTTQPSEIEEFGIEVADLWSIGRKGIDDGLIFIIAKDDRRQRLEVGRGLSGVIPDAVAKRIIAEITTPYFQKGDFAGGINAGVDKIISLVEGETLPPPQTLQNRPQDETGFVMLLFGGLFAGSLLSSAFGRVAGGLIAGVGSGFVACTLLGFGIEAIIIGVIVFFLISSRFTSGGGGWTNGGGYYGGGGWSGGGSSSTWRGGGGTFDGGGASGSW